MLNILILAALPEEADTLFPGIGTRNAVPIPLRRLTIHGHSLTIATCGLGKVNAALAAGLLGASTDMLLMTGTCGALGASPGAYWIAEAVQHDYGSRLADGFTPYRGGEWPMGPPGVAHFEALLDPGLGLPHARIASGDSFVGCVDHGRWLAETMGATLVDMEVGAVAQVAHRLGVPWAAIKAVTDEADGASAGDFQANLARAAQLAAGEIERLMALL